MQRKLSNPSIFLRIDIITYLNQNPSVTKEKIQPLGYEFPWTIRNSTIHQSPWLELEYHIYSL